MDLPQLSLSSWHMILVGLALEVAFENAGLVFLAFWTQRRWRERVLVVVPLAAFVWLLATARAIQAQLTWWSAYFVFLALHYPRVLPPVCPDPAGVPARRGERQSLGLDSRAGHRRDGAARWHTPVSVGNRSVVEPHDDAKYPHPS
jgi:hypothetical protein